MPHHRSRRLDSVPSTWKTRISMACTATSKGFTPQHWKTRNGFDNVCRGKDTRKRLSVRPRITGPISLFLLGNSGYRALRALHIHALRSCIIVLDDSHLQTSTYGKITHAYTIYSSCASLVVFILSGNNTTSYQTKLHMHICSQDANIR